MHDDDHDNLDDHNDHGDPDQVDDHVPRHAAPRHAKSGRERGLAGWLVPVALAVVGAAALIGAFLLDEHPSAAAVGDDSPVTPVLSARRAPEVVAAPVADRRLQTELEQWVALSPPDTCLVVESGERSLYAHNATTPLAGASTQKLVTAAAALRALGPDARFETVVQASAAPASGVVAGDLYIVGGGDALLASPAYGQLAYPTFQPTLLVDPAQIADAIVAAGITRIDGSIVGDGNRYDAERYHPSWPARFRGQEIGPVGALEVNDGLHSYDGGPAASGDDPAISAATALTQLLQQRGVTVTGPARSGDAPDGLTEVTSFPSPTLREIVHEMLSDSDDMTAEMLIKEIGHQQVGEGSWEAGAAAVMQLLQEAGVTMDGVQVVEGSGLSSQNRLTCQLLTDVLTMPDTGPVLVEGLAVAGQTGTLTTRFDGTPIEGRLRAKTGTLNQVTALAGMVTPTQGGSLTFAYVANVPEPQQVYSYVELQEGLANILLSYPRDVDIAALVPAPVPGQEAAPAG
jgi:serine-type D-Ala-D-Ala carboxypeptidase/endopeptidase (penicillin-binding protein 4)